MTMKQHLLTAAAVLLDILLVPVHAGADYSQGVTNPSSERTVMLQASCTTMAAWVNGEFTPRETMRGKMALLGYLYGIRK